MKILSRWNNACIWEGEAETIAQAVRSAIDSDADLSGADLRNADLRNAGLSDVYLSGVDLSYANLSGADLRDADLRDANLSGADLSDADLSGADLRDANLSGANLSDANLQDADLRGADLSDADLSGADLSGAEFPDGFRICRIDYGRWPITIMPSRTRIGCQIHTNELWLSWMPGDDRIKRMADGADEFWARHHETIKAAIREIMG